ncbi:hypothetical protein ABMA27_004823 [Loxostege sticticalis]|uniref:Transposase n=1 Tax=Loxostege sticticalis TaxID=481309 RepID=A0ABR3HKR7_LOXSC
MERGDILLKRNDFLREAKKITDWNNVVFLDETWLNANHTLSRTWTDNTSASPSKALMGKGSRLIICHAGSAGNGFVENGLFSFQSKNTTDYHELVDKAPSSNEKKTVHVAWLEKHGIEANMEIMKPQLEKLIDELAQVNGHQVLRLPPYHCQYNAIELI